MDNFDSEKFEKRLHNLKNTQDGITALSQWCLAKRAAHKNIVRSWLKVLKEVKIESRLTLFYLANDVIQHSKKKKYDFVESWGTSLQRATPLVRDDKVRHKISRIFGIWEQREIYSEEFISDLNSLLSKNQSKKSSLASNSSGSSPVNSTPSSKNNPPAGVLDDFDDELQLSTVVANIRSCVELENETNKNLKAAVKTPVPDLEKIRSNLKDRSQVEDACQDVEGAANKFQALITSLKEEIQARKLLLTALDQADKFYRGQRKDVKKVVYAYKNFGDRISQIQTDLEAKMPKLHSPCPSPPINAPSPEPDNDFDLPGQLGFNNSSMNGYGSFLKSNAPLPFDPSEFYRKSPPLPISQNNSIQVIQQQEQTSVNDFFNTLSQPKLDNYSSAPPMSYNPQASYQPTPIPPPLPVASSQLDMSAAYSNNGPYMVPPPPPVASQTDFTSGIPLPPAQNSNSYSSWNWNASIETPHSPSTFDRKNHDENLLNDFLEENLRQITNSSDIDHRGMMRTSESDGSGHDIDHRNLISLTGSPGNNGNDANHQANQFLTPPLEPSTHFNNSIYSMNDASGDLSKMSPYNPMMAGRMRAHPNNGSQRLSRNTSYNSDSSRNDEIETVDMEMSDDDTGGMDNQSVGSSGGENRDFSMPNMYPNRPPPLMNADTDMGQQRNFWMQNQLGNDPMMLDDGHQPDSQFSGPPPPFITANNRGNFQSSPNFRGGGHRGNMPPRMFSPNFRGGMRGGMNNRGRGGGPMLRGGFIRGRGGPW